MPIDAKNEHLLTLGQAASILGDRLGNPMDRRDVHRWIYNGCGAVKLECIHCDRTLYTSQEAVNRFIAQTNERFRLLQPKSLPWTAVKALNAATAYHRSRTGASGHCRCCVCRALLWIRWNFYRVVFHVDEMVNR